MRYRFHETPPDLFLENDTSIKKQPNGCFLLSGDRAWAAALGKIRPLQLLPFTSSPDAAYIAGRHLSKSRRFIILVGFQLEDDRADPIVAARNMDRIMAKHESAAGEGRCLQTNRLPRHSTKALWTLAPKRPGCQKNIPFLHHLTGAKIGERNVLLGQLRIKFAF